MKILYSFLSLLLLSASLLAQTPQAINYQGIARNASGSILANQLIALRLSILSENVSGTTVYAETQDTTTDANGLFALKIGQGTVVSGTFNTINWGTNTYFLKVEIDPAGGTNFTMAGTSQFASVPYALYSANGMTSGQNPGDLLYWNGTTWAITPAGTHGQQLSLCDGVPAWGGCPPLVTTTAASNITATTATSGGNVTAQGSSAVTARGVCWSTSPNPTVANTKTIDGSGTGIFTSSLTGLALNTLYHVRAYATNSIGTAYGNEVSFTTLNWLCGTSTLTVNHVAGTTAPVTKTTTYGTVTNIPGEPAKCWITKNLGATNQATAVSDATEAAAGWYWQFNRKQGFKHDGTTRTPATTWIYPISENTNWTTANDPCTLELGSIWRLPTSTEWTNVDASGSWTNWTGPWNSGLKLHAAGYLYGSDGSLNSRGSSGYYWSSTQDSTTYGWYLFFGSGFSYVSSSSKAHGFPLRCLRD